MSTEHQVYSLQRTLHSGPIVFPASINRLRNIVPLYMVLALSPFVSPMLTLIVDEKEKKIKESLKMVGLMDSVFW